MKTKKKLASLVCAALMMILALSMTAFAEKLEITIETMLQS